jgi:hypothetical protein
VAGGDVAIRAGRDAAGRDLIIEEGFKLRTKMRSSAKNCIRLGCLAFLAGQAVLLYFVLTWQSRIFDAITDPNVQPPSDLPSPLPWLPLGGVLTFVGFALVVVGLLIPRDRIFTRSER